MAPTTPMVDGRFYIFDFLTNGDMDNQELNGKTPGDDYFVGEVITYRSQAPLDFEKELFYGSKGYGIRYNSI